MEKVTTTNLFTIETKVFLEQKLLDVNLDSKTTITLSDGRYTAFKYASGSINLTALNPVVNEMLTHALQEMLNGVVQKVVDELMIVPRTEIGAAWKK